MKSALQQWSQELEWLFMYFVNLRLLAWLPLIGELSIVKSTADNNCDSLDLLSIVSLVDKKHECILAGLCLWLNYSI